MTKKDARAYLRRWQLVDQVLRGELRLTPMEEKFQKMEAAYRMAAGMGILGKMKALKQKSEHEVRHRWLRLKTPRP